MVSSDKDLESRRKTLSEDMSEGLHILSHDPSLAMYRLQEHVRKSLPVMVEKRIEIMQLQNGLQGACYDIENAIEAVQSMGRSSKNFSKIYELLRTSMYHKQQLDYERMRRDDKKVSKFSHSDSTDSLVQEMRKTRSMGHIRDSASDIMSESMISRSTTSTPVSEYPESLLTGTERTPETESPGTDEPLEMGKPKDKEKPGSRSSTPTSGADSPDRDQLDSEEEPQTPLQ